MPRQGRIDAPGALHHVISRGLERREIFRDDLDRRAFLDRLGGALEQSGTICYAWALLPNHFHLLLVTGRRPIGRVLQSVLAGYAQYFNRRHRRCGHLFQNRFKSVLCEREAYLLELIRYLHLNPLRAGVVGDLRELGRYAWSGHAGLAGKKAECFQEIEGVLSLFGRRVGVARKEYLGFIAQGAGQGRRPELTGGGMVRSLGGWEEVQKARRGGERQAGDERILGSGDFVGETLRAAEEQERRASRLRRSGWTGERVLARAARVAGVKSGELPARGRRRGQSLGRSLASKWLVDDLGWSGVAVAELLGLTPAGVTYSVQRGREQAQRLGLGLEG